MRLCAGVGKQQGWLAKASVGCLLGVSAVLLFGAIPNMVRQLLRGFAVQVVGKPQ